MKGVIIFAVVCLMVISESFADDQLQCYQCPHVTSECPVDKATSIKCGSSKHSRCSKQIIKGSTDQSKAIRKCVVPDTSGQVSCPDNSDCYICDSDFCNSGSMAKLTWISLAGVLFTVLYM